MVKDITATLTEKKQLNHNVWQFSFKVNGDTVEFAPGQYMLLKINDQFRQYSISSSAMQTDTMEFIMEYFEGGLASTYLTQLEIGQTAEFKGPAGVFTLRNTDRNKIFLATGTGIAPIKSMIETYLEQGGQREIHLYFGLKNRDEMYLQDELNVLSGKYANFSYTYCLSREESLDGLDTNYIVQGRVNAAVEEYIAEQGGDFNLFEYYLCGSQTIVESLKEYLFGKGTTPDNTFFENFG